MLQMQAAVWFKKQNIGSEVHMISSKLTTT